VPQSAAVPVVPQSAPLPVRVAEIARLTALAAPSPSRSPAAELPSPVPAQPDAPSPRAAASASPVPAVTPSPSGVALPQTPAATTVSQGAMPGFDTCTAPSLQAMQAWRSRFSATGIYIGGEEMACDYGNLSAAWIKAAEAMGWSLLPVYVGPQAPCNTFDGKVDAKHAAAQGRDVAQNAVADAQTFGLGKGTPIYYDMEAYNATKASCVTAVLTFLDAWTRQLNADGYLSGVYSSAGSGITDLGTETTVAGHPLAEPQSLWFALWDNADNLNGEPYLSGSAWPPSHRSKQYAGSHWVKIHGYGLDVDSDLVDSAVVR
jgi:hypothetical protein